MNYESIKIPFHINETKMDIEVIKTNMMGVIDSFQDINFLDNKPGVYVFYSNKELYVGESSQPMNRLKQHIASAKLDSKKQILIFRSDKFNKSAIYDIETRLIDLFNASQEYKLLNTKTNQGKHSYFLQEYYEASVEKIWNHLLKKGISKYEIQDIEKLNIYKFSPFKDLNSDQQHVVDEVKQSKSHLTIVKGHPGTGKSIVASVLFNLLQKENKVALVTGTVATFNAFKNVFKKTVKNSTTGSKVIRAKDVINNEEKYDIILIDEGHRLLKKGGKGMGAKYMHLAKGQNEFDELQKKAKRTILFYDDNQTVHDGDFNFNFSKYNFEKEFRLREQMRASNSFGFVNFIVEFMSNNFFEYKKNSDYELKIFDSFKQMYETLKVKSENNTLTRVLSGYSREWVSKKQPNKFDFKIEGIELKWNSTEDKWIHSKPAKELKEVGYYSAVQGFDLRYSGVIIGKDIYLDENDVIQINEDFIFGVNQKPKKADPLYNEKLKTWTLNRYKVLLSRATKGTYLYIEDDKLRNKLKELIK